VQKVNSFDREMQTNNSSGAWYELGPPLTGSVLDTSYPYPQWTTDNKLTVDAPAQGLVNSPDAPYKTVKTADSFTMWLMFQPSGGQPVPLRTVSWSWSGTAVLTNTPDTNGNYWVLTSSTNTPSPTDSDSTTHPEWTDNVTNHFVIMPK
jgi:hypothetical protein